MSRAPGRKPAAPEVAAVSHGPPRDEALDPFDADLPSGGIAPPVLGRLGRVSVLVDDYDEAMGFYVERLGFEVRYDGALGDGTRLVHLELPTQEGTGVWLFEAGSDEQRERVGNQTGGAPLGVFYTDDCRGVAEELEERGVEVGGMRESPEDVSVHVEDLYGNRFVLVELKG